MLSKQIDSWTSSGSDSTRIQFTIKLKKSNGENHFVPQDVQHSQRSLGVHMAVNLLGKHTAITSAYPLKYAISISHEIPPSTFVFVLWDSSIISPAC